MLGRIGPTARPTPGVDYGIRLTSLRWPTSRAAAGAPTGCRPGRRTRRSGPTRGPARRSPRRPAAFSSASVASASAITDLQVVQRAGLHLGEPAADRDRAGRPGRGQLHEPDLVTHRLVVIDVEADLLVERLGHVDVGHGHHDQFQLHLHDPTLDPRADSIGPLVRSVPSSAGERRGSQTSPIPRQLAAPTAACGTGDRPCRHGDSSDRSRHREVLSRRRRHDDHAQAGRRPPDRRRPRGADRRARAGAEHLPPQPRRPDPPARQARPPGPRGAREVPARPRARHLAGHPGPQGAQARATPRRTDSRRAARAPAGRRSRRPDRGDVRVPRRPAAASSTSTRPCGSRVSTPAPSTPTCATSGCTTSGRASGPATAARSWSATPAACTSVTAYAAWLSSQTSPGSASS